MATWFDGFMVAAHARIALLAAAAACSGEIGSFGPIGSNDAGSGNETHGDGGGGGGSDLDCFGVKTLYPTKAGGQTWCVNMDDPKSDPRFRNVPTITRQSDGSWQVHGRESPDWQLRMEAWSEPGRPWVNVEITEYAKVISVGPEGALLQMYSRGGHHSEKRPCEGSAYKSRLWFDRRATWVKEICHPAYTDNRGEVEEVTTVSLIGRWVGHKAVIYNVTDGGSTHVRMESYIDDDVEDADGELVVRNNWKLMTTVEDRGGWTSGSYGSECGACNYENGQILIEPGGIDDANIAAWRSDDTLWNWKYLSVREIEPPARGDQNR
jgi:hypothetical protein